MLVTPPFVTPSLSTTLINTKNRAKHKGLPAAERTRRGKDKRIPFNLATLYASESFKRFQTGNTEENPEDLQQPISIDIGEVDITSLCLRKVAMPSETKEPVHDGKIDFTD